MSTNNSFIHPTLFPGGVADPDGRTGYVHNASGGIDALDLTSGALLWSTAHGSRPLVVVENRLVAQARVKGMPNALQIVVLDVAKDGQLLLTSDPVIFPVRISIFAASEEEFSLQVQVDGNDLLLIWEAHTRYRGGAPPPQRVIQQATADNEGLARVNLQTGKVIMLSLPSEMSPSASPILLPVGSLPYQFGATLHNEPWKVDSQFAVLVLESARKKTALFLQHWSTGEPPTLVQSTELLEGSAFVVALTLNGQYLFVHREPTPIRDANWHVFSAQSGQPVAKFPYEPETQEIQVLDGRMFYIVAAPQGKGRRGATIQIELRARSLTTGETLWQHLLVIQGGAPPKLRA